MPENALTKDTIRNRATSQSYTRGETYFHNGAIFDTIRRGEVLEGRCEASSQSAPYHIRVTLDQNGIQEATCTCLYEYGGDCKHIVALLLTYFNHPEQFEERQSVESALAARNKDELIALIGKMVKRYPDLEVLLDLPVA